MPTPTAPPSYITITFDLEGDSLERLLNRKFRTPQKAVLLLQQMLRERDQEDGYTADMLISLLSQLLLTILREAEGSSRPPLRTANAINNENEVVGHAQRYIGQNVRIKLSVPMVAREVGVSPSYLTALFHKKPANLPWRVHPSGQAPGEQTDDPGRQNELHRNRPGPPVLPPCITSPGSLRKKFGITPHRIRPVHSVMPTDRNNIMKNPDGIFRWAGWHSVTYTGCHLFCIAPNSPYTVSAGPSVRPAETLCVSRPFSGNSECPPRADPCVRPRGNPSPLHPPPANSQCSLQADIQILTHGQIRNVSENLAPGMGDSLRLF